MRINMMPSSVSWARARNLSNQMGELGSGSGKAGGSGGTIRDAGGAFGKRGQAEEGRYFWELNKQLTEDLKKRRRRQPTVEPETKGDGHESADHDKLPPADDSGSAGGGSDATPTDEHK